MRTISLRVAVALLLAVLPLAASAQPREPVADAPHLNLPAPAEAASLARGSIFFVGNATVIIRYGGFTILTDPNFLHKGDHVHLGYGLKSQRLTDPAITLDKLPPIDFIVLSHYHGDHFDQLVQEKLDRNIPVVSTPDSVGHLRKLGFNTTFALRKWEQFSATKGGATVRITAMPAQHGPKLLHRALPETMGSMLEFRPTAATGPNTAWRLYISGDTLVHEALAEIPKRHPGIDTALLHLGGTRALGVLVTMDAEQGVEAIRILDPRLTLPIHYDDYTVFKSPLSDFLKAVDAAGLKDRVKVLQRGETFDFTVPPERLK